MIHEVTVPKKKVFWPNFFSRQGAVRTGNQIHKRTQETETKQTRWDPKTLGDLKMSVAIT